MAMGFAMNRQPAVKSMAQIDANVASTDYMRTATRAAVRVRACVTAGTATFYDGRQLSSRPDQRVVWRSIR
jgi:hypothetical protein